MSHSVSHAVVILFSATMVSRVLGLIREMLVARYFGASSEYDLYLVAVSVPVSICTILQYALPSAFIPAFSRSKIESNGQRHAPFQDTFITLVGMILFILSAGLYFGAEKIVLLYGVSGQESVVSILRITSVIVLLGGLFSILKSYLNAHKHFFSPAFSLVLNNIVLIIAILVFVPSAGTIALAWAVASGFLVQVLVLFVVARFKFGLEFKPDFDMRNPLALKSINIILVIMLVECFGQMFTIIDRSFLPVLDEGAVSGIAYAAILLNLPISIIGVTLGTAVFPSIADFVARKEWDKLQTIVTVCIKNGFVITVPLTVYYMFYPDVLIRVFYQRGAFNEHDLLITSAALRYYSIGIFSFVMHAVFIKMIYALGHKKKLIITGFVYVTSKYLLSYAFVSSMGHRGLALATSLAGILNIMMLLFVERQHYPAYLLRDLVLSFLKLSAVALASFFCMKTMLDAFPTITNKYAEFSVSAVLMAGLVVLLGRLTRNRDIGMMLDRSINAAGSLLKGRERAD